MNGRESYSSRLACTLEGEAAIARATDTARSFGQAQGLADDELARLCILIEELVANLYDHGGLTDTDRVELILSAERGHIRVALIDRGAPFDVRTAPRGGEIPERGGGAGLDIVRAWAEIVGYDVTEEGNRLEFLLPIR